MNAVFRHEVSSHFHSLSAYVFGAFLLLFGGVYTMVMNLNNLLTNFEFVMGNMAFIFLIIVPILTMRVLAEERRQKTDQLLYSLPISMTDVVLGKFGALLVMLLIPLAIIALYPVVLSAFGNIHFPTAYGAMLGFFLLGAALIAIGLFISSITESQAVAAGLCFVVMLLNYYISDLATFVAATAFASFSAFASWSGQEVDFMPQRMPSTRAITSATSMPSTRAAMPFRLPLQPPTNCTFLTLPSSTSKKIRWEQVPLVLYSY